tara:strand:+ start:527 stop:988 length:462 start_codon:yes stop_codon:yes gene_type:complete
MSKSLNSDITKLITKYLSIREHSQLELRNKLSDKGYNNDEIFDAINEFVSKDIQSDLRFTEEFIRSRLKKNKGPRLITSELINRGISESIISNKLSEIPESEWHKLAAAALAKKLNTFTSTIHNEEKIYSFLISRGFEYKMIKYVLKEFKNER